MSSKKRFFTLFAVTLFGVLAPPRASRAQLVFGGPNASLHNLKDTLPFVYWDSRTHGPLIAITPEKVRDDRYVDKTPVADLTPDEEEARQPLLQPKEGDKLSAEHVARHFQHKLVHLPTLTIFAPLKMAILNTDLTPPNPFLGGQLWDKMARLEATLTAAQWQSLGSPGGLGMGDLTKNQQEIFSAILPETVTVNHATLTQFGGGYVGYQTQTSNDQTLTPEQRGDIRLRLERRSQMNLVDGKNHYGGFPGGFHSEAVGTQQLVLSQHPAFSDLAATMFGQSVRQEAPNSLKPSDLDLTQPLLRETWVPLTGAKTVGDLLKAASEKTGLEVYADGRLAALSVSLSTEGRLVRASDLLEGLCWALTATYRKVGPVPGGDPKDFAYVLTYDRAGLAALRGKIADWARRGFVEQQANSTQFNEQVQKAKPGQYLSYGGKDLLSATPEAEQALHDSQRENIANNDYSASATVPLSVLTPAQRQQAMDAFKQVDANRASNPNAPQPRYDRVSLSQGVGLTYMLPGGGEIRDGSMWGGSEFARTDESDSATNTAAQERQRQQIKKMEQSIADAKRDPLILSHLIVRIAPASFPEAQSLLDAAPPLGITDVWVATPDTDVGRKLLADAVAEGKRVGVRVGAAVSLIHIDPGDTRRTPAMEDMNLFGETGATWIAHVKSVVDGFDFQRFYGAPALDDSRDSLAPEAPATETLLAQRLNAVAAMPGLSTLALDEASGPGRVWSASRQPDYFSWTGSEFGFTVANRLAFLRQSGYDPIDLNSQGYDYGSSNVQQLTTLPHFDLDSDNLLPNYYSQRIDNTTPLTAWHTYLAASQSKLLERLRADLASAHPDQVVYLEAPAILHQGWSVGSLQKWASGAPIPFAASPISANPTSPTAPKPDKAAAATSEPETIHSFTLGAFYAPAFEAARTNKTTVADTDHLFDYAAFYVRNALKSGATARSGVPAVATPPSAPPGIVLDFTGMKSGDALTLLKGVMASLHPTIVPEGAQKTASRQ